MKLYRATFVYNNDDSCEWEQWYRKSSLFYTTKEHAEKHLEELNKYKNFVVNYFKNGYGCFKYKEPFIEELEVHDDFVPLVLDYTNEDKIFEDLN